MGTIWLGWIIPGILLLGSLMGIGNFFQLLKGLGGTQGGLFLCKFWLQEVFLAQQKFFLFPIGQRRKGTFQLGSLG